MKKDIQSISSPTPRNIRSVRDKHAKALAKVPEIKKEAPKKYAKFVENQDTIKKATQGVERLWRGYDDFDT